MLDEATAVLEHYAEKLTENTDQKQVGRHSTASDARNTVVFASIHDFVRRPFFVVQKGGEKRSHRRPHNDPKRRQIKRIHTQVGITYLDVSV